MTFSDFVGIPHADLGRDRTGADCWGLVRIVYREALGIELPTLDGRYAGYSDLRGIAALMVEQERAWIKVSCPQPYDVLRFRTGSHDTHVGLAVDHKTMLHTHARSHSVIVSRHDPEWRDRLTGIFRHEAML